MINKWVFSFFKFGIISFSLKCVNFNVLMSIVTILLYLLGCKQYENHEQRTINLSYQIAWVSLHMKNNCRSVSSFQRFEHWKDYFWFKFWNLKTRQWQISLHKIFFGWSLVYRTYLIIYRTEYLSKKCPISNNYCEGQ